MTYPMEFKSTRVSARDVIDDYSPYVVYKFGWKYYVYRVYKDGFTRIVVTRGFFSRLTARHVAQAFMLMEKWGVNDK